MSGPLQVIPPGLLGYFQLKTGGRNPGELGEALQPVLESFDWYMQANMVNLQDIFGFPSIAVANAATGPRVFSPNNILVPQNEIWWVDHFTVRSAQLMAGEQAKIAPVLQLPQLGTVTQLLLGDFDFERPLLAADIVVARAARGFFAPPGSSLGVFVSNIVTAGTITFSGYGRVARCRL